MVSSLRRCLRTTACGRHDVGALEVGLAVVGERAVWGVTSREAAITVRHWGVRRLASSVTGRGTLGDGDRDGISDG